MGIKTKGFASIFAIVAAGGRRRNQPRYGTPPPPNGIENFKTSVWRLGALSHAVHCGGQRRGLVAHAGGAAKLKTLGSAFRAQRGRSAHGYANGKAHLGNTTPPDGHRHGRVTRDREEGVAKARRPRKSMGRLDRVGLAIPGWRRRGSASNVIAGRHVVQPERCKQVAFATPNTRTRTPCLTLKGQSQRNLQSTGGRGKNPPTAKLAVHGGLC